MLKSKFKRSLRAVILQNKVPCATPLLRSTRGKPQPPPAWLVRTSLLQVKNALEVYKIELLIYEATHTPSTSPPIRPIPNLRGRFRTRVRSKASRKERC